MKRRPLLAATVAALACLTAVRTSTAAPSVTSTSGTFSHGNSVTISGSSFGSKATADPLKWETFEDGVVGTNVETTGYWSAEHPARTLFDDDTNISLRHAHSDRHVHWHGLPYPSATMKFYRDDIGFADTGKAYVNFWVYLDYVDGDTEEGVYGWQLKVFRVTENEDHGSQPYFRLQSYTDDNETASTFIGEVSNASSIWSGGPSEGYWINMALEYEDSTLDQTDGNVHFYHSKTPMSSGSYYKGVQNRRGHQTRFRNRLGGLPIDGIRDCQQRRRGQHLLGRRLRGQLLGTHRDR